VRPSLPAPARRAGLLRAATAAVLALGYLDLARGGTTLAPLLLVAGYVALVPTLLLQWR
jgi:hypothetical protein